MRPIHLFAFVFLVAPPAHALQRVIDEGTFTTQAAGRRGVEHFVIRAASNDPNGIIMAQATIGDESTPGTVSFEASSGRSINRYQISMAKSDEKATALLAGGRFQLAWKTASAGGDRSRQVVADPNATAAIDAGVATGFWFLIRAAPNGGRVQVLQPLAGAAVIAVVGAPTAGQLTTAGKTVVTRVYSIALGQEQWVVETDNTGRLLGARASDGSFEAKRNALP